MALPNDDRRGSETARARFQKDTAPAWLKALPWLLVGFVILLLILSLSYCHKSSAGAGSATNSVIGETPNAKKTAALESTSGLGTYLAGTGTAPRSFAFDKLNFDTAKNDIRAADLGAVDEVATVLKQYPAAHIRIAGFADARGDNAANVQLGKARAESVKAALVSEGIAADRIETVSGGATDPVDTNATPSGRLQNRRTELVVTAR